MEIYTIGFTKKTAEDFFTRLKKNGIERLLDVRLNNTSQLASFAKIPDLQYFLEKLGNIEYLHEPMLAPTQDILDKFKKEKGSWEDYTKSFMDLMQERTIEENLNPKIFEKKTVLLCSEDTHVNCHRSLVIDYLNEKWGNVKAHNI